MSEEKITIYDEWDYNNLQDYQALADKHVDDAMKNYFDKKILSLDIIPPDKPRRSNIILRTVQKYNRFFQKLKSAKGK